jgi:hypothetical protein
MGCCQLHNSTSSSLGRARAVDQRRFGQIAPFKGPAAWYALGGLLSEQPSQPPIGN